MVRLFGFALALGMLLVVADQASAKKLRFVTSEAVDIVEIPAFGGPPPSGYYVSPSGHHIGQPFKVRRTPAPEVWNIPAGRYGLQLQDGTKMIGRPAKGWSVKLKTTFGPVDIPLEQVARLAPTKDGRMTAYFKNGDRVSGVAMAQTFKYETTYGVLTIRCNDIARMDSSNFKVAATTGTTSGSKTPSVINTGKRPPRVRVIREEESAGSSDSEEKSK